MLKFRIKILLHRLGLRILRDGDWRYAYGEYGHRKELKKEFARIIKRWFPHLIREYRLPKDNPDLKKNSERLDFDDRDRANDAYARVMGTNYKPRS